ncbi:unnamed protein product, partial [marine sediment metagenome]
MAATAVSGRFFPGLNCSLIAGLRTQDRFGVQAIDPHALELTEATAFKVTVTTSSGTYEDEVVVMTHMPYAVSLGINNVPIRANSGL